MPDEQHLLEVVDYDPAWPAEFELEARAVRASLAQWLTGSIEHVGSTAVVGMSAKPVLDIMAPVQTLADSRPAIAVLERHHGYSYRPYRADVMHWLCKPSEHVRTHHLYLVPLGSDLFRQRTQAKGPFVAEVLARMPARS